ncbi:hypothetical protein, partial [Nodosilinea sp. LEGE 07298]|uniref:hypothetical protein n=1 Tax=Nodosilinea sp. LEGE 07298 TaxID=2777970 RepID=UPI001D14F16A
NSDVKRSCGEDSEGVAPCQNSSMPGSYSKPCDIITMLHGFAFQASFLACYVTSDFSIRSGLDISTPGL